MNIATVRSAQGSPWQGAPSALFFVDRGDEFRSDAPERDGEIVQFTGLLTDDGADCEALRADHGEILTLLGDLQGFGEGQRVRVSGRLLDETTSQPGTALRVLSIVPI